MGLVPMKAKADIFTDSLVQASVCPKNWGWLTITKVLAYYSIVHFLLIWTPLCSKIQAPVVHEDNGLITASHFYPSWIIAKIGAILTKIKNYLRL